MLRLDWLVRSHRRESVGASRGPNLGRDTHIHSFSRVAIPWLKSLPIINYIEVRLTTEDSITSTNNHFTN